MKNFIFKIDDNSEISLLHDEGVFQPTATTNYLINGVIKKLHNKNISSLLDLGCGSGVVGISLFKKLTINKIFASDYSKRSTEVAKENFLRNKTSYDVRHGSLYEPWDSYKFDVIVDDISGISSVIASISSWFEGVPCESGDDGTDLTIKVLENSKKHLNPNGVLFFPVIGLSDTSKIEMTANKIFGSFEVVSENEWPIPKDLLQHDKLLNDLQDKKKINLIEKFGIKLCITKIIMVTA